MPEHTSGRNRTAVITGAAGQLGSALAESFADTYDVVPLTRADLDITDHAAVVGRIMAARPAVIINCAAYNDVDGAEDDAVRALAINAMAVRSLAHAAEATGAVLVHYSTDFVFDGETDHPYTEEDLPSPRSVYAQSKLVSEWMAASISEHYVLRVESLFGGLRARSSIDRIIAALRAGEDARVFHDRIVSPTFVDDAVAATAALLERGAPWGVYHCVNTGHPSWFEVGLEIARVLGVSPGRLIQVSVADVPLPAPRPRYAALDNTKLRNAGHDMPAWQDALSRYLAR